MTSTTNQHRRTLFDRETRIIQAAARARQAQLAEDAAIARYMLPEEKLDAMRAELQRLASKVTTW